MPFFWHRPTGGQGKQAGGQGKQAGGPSRHTQPTPPSTTGGPGQSPPRPTHTRVAPQVVETSDDEYRILANKRPPSRASSIGRRFVILDLPFREPEPSNRLLVFPSDFPSGTHVLVNEDFPFTVKHDETGKLASGQVAVSDVQRQWMGISSNASDNAAISQIDYPFEELHLVSLDLEIDFSQSNLDLLEPFFVDELAERFIQSFHGQILCQDQRQAFLFHGQSFKVIVKALSILEPMDEEQQTAEGIGILMEKTKITFIKAGNSRIKLKATKPTDAVLPATFKFEDLGIGGLDTEFSTIFRRAFASRIFPPELATRFGAEHVKGIILFGPPGTGKTLMARQIGRVLKAREPKIVNGPEILSKFVGESEELIRKLFADAEKEYKEKKDKSGLHIIIFDELDSICKRRGGDSGAGGRVGDGIVNQLLSKMDGVEQLNNILLIGMTNRLDMIDEALLRPGRFEVPVVFPMPDDAGRQQILTIHTSKMRDTGHVAADVDLGRLAAHTNTFTGADISGLVRCATSFAFNRYIKLGSTVEILPDIKNLRVNMSDFTLALDEVRPALGASLAELEEAVPHGIIDFDDNIKTLLNDGALFVEQVRDPGGQSPFSILLHGPSGSGKTALAVTIAKNSQFPFIKLVSPESMVGFSEVQKSAAINRVFTDSYKSPLSVIIIDNIERLIEWSPLGPRFSSFVLRDLLVLLQRQPPTGHRLLIICTTSIRQMLTELQMSEIFDADFHVPPITSLRSVEVVLHAVQLFWRDKGEQRLAMAMMHKDGFAPNKTYGSGTETRKLQIGIKKLLRIVEMASQDRRKIAERLSTALKDHAATPTASYTL